MTSVAVEIWHGPLDAEAAGEDYFLTFLSADERQHAQKLNNPAVRKRMIAVRARLRCLLALKLHQDAVAIVIDKGEHGKPYLPDFPEFAFNLSHSGDYLAIALGRECSLGIDIEQIKARKNLLGLAEKCFSQAELNHWQNLPEAERLPDFYRLWTAKEAFVKATGQGIQLGLNRCAVAVQTWKSFSDVPIEYEPASRWQLRCFDLTGQFVGALVVDSVASQNASSLAITPYPLAFIEELG
jgi:4'-phosphopantetheinyl transferase